MAPTNAAELFTEALPRWFALGAEQLGEVSLAPVPITVRVVGSGEWTLCVQRGELQVQSGMSSDTALQLTVSQADFDELLLQRLPDDVDPLALLGSQRDGAWRKRLERLDAETADLLRRVDGTLLVRFDDAGLTRALAVTPGKQPYDLQAASCTVDCELKALRAAAEKQQSPLDLLSTGAVRLSGDAQVALALAGLFL